MLCNAKKISLVVIRNTNGHLTSVVETIGQVNKWEIVLTFYWEFNLTTWYVIRTFSYKGNICNSSLPVIGYLVEYSRYIRFYKQVKGHGDSTLLKTTTYTAIDIYSILRWLAKSIVKTEGNKYLVPNTDSESRWWLCNAPSLHLK